MSSVTFDSHVKLVGYELWAVVPVAPGGAAGPKQRTVWVRDLPFRGSRSASTAYIYLN